MDWTLWLTIRRFSLGMFVACFGAMMAAGVPWWFAATVAVFTTAVGLCFWTAASPDADDAW